MRLINWMSTAVVMIAGAGTANAIVLGELDNFEGGGTESWTNGPFADPVNISTGGPAGLNDNYMQITSTGGIGAGSRMIAFNRTQWLGNYITAGVGAVEMDLRNFGGSPLSVRLAIKQDISLGSPGYVSTTPFALINDGAWHHATFVLSALDMTLIGGPLAFNTLMAGPGEVRIISAATATSLNGDVIAGQLGVDNIFAQVPEPASLGLLCLSAAVILRRRHA